MAQDRPSSHCTNSKAFKACRNFTPKILGLAAAMAIGGCAATKPPLELTLVQQIQHAIIDSCGYKVQIDSLIAVLNTFVPGAGLLTLAVDTVCQVVEPLTVGHAGPAVRVPPPVVNGVPLKGHFVGKTHTIPLPRPRPK